MPRSIKFLFPTLAASLLLAACGSSSSSSTPAPAPAQPAAAASTGNGSSALVKTATNTKLGTTVLVDAQGMTLYHLSGEQNGKFICSSAKCVHLWPPLTIKGGSKPSGAVALGTVKRPDGAEQVTYQGMPLYTFAHDTAAGQANGQGIKDVGTWSAATTRASAAKTSAPAATSTSSSGGGGYGY